MLDAVVIGAGPSGSRAAGRLAGLGHKVAVLEQRAAPGQKLCCTGIVSRECAAYLEIPKELALRQVAAARIVSPSGRCVALERKEPQAWVLNRPAFDCWLAQEAARSGVDYQFKFRVSAISISAEGAVVESDLPARRVEARTVVLASGFNSGLVKGCGLGQPARWVRGVQAEVELIDVPEIEIYFDQQLASGYFAWIVPTSAGKGLVGLLGNRSPGERLRGWLAALRRRGRIKEKEYELHRWGIPLKPLVRSYAERVLVVGDAAGQVKPTTGGGIYFGAICADLAAKTLHNSLTSHDCSARSLSGYQKEWQARLKRELQLEYLARQLYRLLDNDRLDGVFARLQSSSAFSHLLSDSELSFDWHGGLILRALKAGLADQLAGWARQPARLLRSLERTTE